MVVLRCDALFDEKHSTSQQNDHLTCSSSCVSYFSSWLAHLTTFNCYIDESGDEGLTPKSKPWFVLSALVVSQDEEKLVRGFENECKQQIWIANGHTPPTQLHFAHINHSQKRGVSRILNGKPFKLVVIAIQKTRVYANSHLGDHQTFFRYTTRFLLERVSWYVSDNNGRVNITFSNRGQTDVKELRRYISNIKGRSDCRIRDVFDPAKIRAQNTSHDEMLRAADVCASSFGNGLNPDQWGCVNNDYADELFSHLYRYRTGTVWGNGFKAFPCDTPNELIAIHPHAANWLK